MTRPQSAKVLLVRRIDRGTPKFARCPAASRFRYRPETGEEAFSFFSVYRLFAVAGCVAFLSFSTVINARIRMKKRRRWKSLQPIAELIASGDLVREDDRYLAGTDYRSGQAEWQVSVNEGFAVGEAVPDDQISVSGRYSQTTSTNMNA